LKFECAVALTSGREGKEVTDGVAVVALTVLLGAGLELRLDVGSSEEVVVVDANGLADSMATEDSIVEGVAVAEGVSEMVD
jgi:hypothetical protein